MIKSIYLQTFEIFKKIPVKLWGISLLAGVLEFAAVLFGGLPIISIPLTAALSAGLTAVFYKAYISGGEADTKTLLSPFTDWKTFKHVAGGICWMYLWLFLWLIIPIAGPIIFIYKSFQYAFTPYILTQETSVGGIDALKKSKEDTKGYKTKMLLAIFLPALAYVLVSVILSLLGIIPYVGIVFRIINFIVGIIWTLFAGLFFGLVSAGFYDIGKKPAKKVEAPSPAAAPTGEITVTDGVVTVAPAAEAAVDTPAETTAENTAVVCQVCGSENSADKKFCTKCGAKL